MMGRERPGRKPLPARDRVVPSLGVKPGTAVRGENRWSAASLSCYGAAARTAIAEDLPMHIL